MKVCPFRDWNSLHAVLELDYPRAVISSDMKLKNLPKIFGQTPAARPYDLVGPFPPSDGFTFLLTCIDRYTRWPEVIPVRDISAEAAAKSFIANWISRFGVPVIITTDQGGQFQSRLLYSLKQMFGMQRIRTTPYHPSSNGMAERLHRTLKQAIRCHDTKWTVSTSGSAGSASVHQGGPQCILR
ncbi:retrovirus-related Pol polyprotein from transposon 412 [Trichonephila inaurata madagascariensis]|uniref:Retrovirus-related Pol polyprotein from transposon 412 n=1 Tax=Trichonephila inaurata madagascariensis TaxID=2747483 RepID=A0A8X6WVI2_9ARAC|nr:retrovirus-related Pol polyprotein from transposon 412 [Trichonephila inaurata madagascariensis]